jgi:hypothetical protein
VTTIADPNDDRHCKIAQGHPASPIRQTNTRLAQRIHLNRNYGPVSPNAVATITEHRRTTHKLRPATVFPGHSPVWKKQEETAKLNAAKPLPNFSPNFHCNNFNRMKLIAHSTAVH